METLFLKKMERLKEKEADQRENLKEVIISTLKQKQRSRLDDLYGIKRKDLTALSIKLRKRDLMLKSKGMFSKN